MELFSIRIQRTFQLVSTIVQPEVAFDKPAYSQEIPVAFIPVVAGVILAECRISLRIELFQNLKETLNEIRIGLFQLAFRLSLLFDSYFAGGGGIEFYCAHTLSSFGNNSLAGMPSSCAITVCANASGLYFPEIQL